MGETGFARTLRYIVNNLDSLFNSCIKSDLLLCYKFLAGHADVDVSRFFTDAVNQRK